MLEVFKTIFKNAKELNWFFEKIVTDSKTITLYIGNLPFNIREEQIWEFFTTIGEVKRVIFGINRINSSPCGFCFVEFCQFKINVESIICLNGIKLNQKKLRVDFDKGFEEGRQFGKGKRGGQIIEELENPKKKLKTLIQKKH